MKEKWKEGKKIKIEKSHIIFFTYYFKKNYYLNSLITSRLNNLRICKFLSNFIYI